MMLLRTAVQRQLRRSIVSKKYASTEELAKKAPHDGIPFKAKPEDSTKGELGQVKMPDLTEWEHVNIQIPSEPDNYKAKSDNFDDEFPRFHAPTQAVYAVTSPQDGQAQRISHGGGDDTVLAEAGDALSSLPREADVSRGKEPGRLMAMLNDVTGVSIGHGNGQPSEEWHFQDRPLSSDEQNGLYALAGIVAGGYLLSRFLTDPPRKEKHPVE